MKFTNKELLYGAGLLAGGLLLGWMLFSGPGNGSHSGHLSETEIERHIQDDHTDTEGNIVYTCSMHPSVRENEPGNCPICGMELIPANQADSEAEENEYSMVMTAASAELARIQTAPVIRGTPEKELLLPGRIEVDERALTSVTAWFPGRIEEVKVDFTGAPVRKGEVVATIYSPELITAQRELLEAGRQRERNPRLYESSRQKFLLWGFSDTLIDDIIEGGEVRQELEITSPVDGYVLSRNVADLDYVQEGSVLFEVADLSRLWLMLEAYEEDLNWIETGDEITFHSRSNPSEHYSATVSYIDPVIDPKKRTVGIRANLENTSRQFKPDMLVRGTLSARMDSEKLMVPASAILWTGPRSLVYVQDTSAELPRYEVREVELGARAGDYYVIEEGVREGEEVVFHGNFRIDSEFQLADKFSMMNREPGSGARPGGHDHGNMEENMEMEEDDHSEHEQQESDAGSHEGHSETVMDEDLEDLIPHYLKTREALANDDFDTAQEHIKKLTDTNFNDIEELRLEFRTISDILVVRVEEEGYDGELFKQYCPMYEGGSTWISASEEVVNPYYGVQMHNCGKTVQKIES